MSETLLKVENPKHDWGTEYKGIEFVVLENGDIRVYTECCGCTTPLTAEQMDELTAAWKKYRDA